jgi:hypothetical protein
MTIEKGDQVRMTQLCIAQLAANKQSAFFVAFQQAGFQGIVLDVTQSGVSIHPLQQADVLVTLQAKHIDALLEKVETHKPVQHNPNMESSATAHPFDLKHTPLPIVQAYHLLTYFSHTRDRLVAQACEQYRQRHMLELQTLVAKGGSEIDLTVATAPFEINFGGEEQLLADASHAMLNDYLSLSYEIERHKLLAKLEQAENPVRQQTPVQHTGVTQLDPIAEPIELPEAAVVPPSARPRRTKSSQAKT